MQLRAMHPGVTVDEIQANSSFEIQIPPVVETAPPPTEEERRLLREIDPAGIIIGK